ncbi:MAG: UvrD-helicase domain-containing protein [Bryobacterales bacterium]|nr:UvrD-helicase domain-containing protein [Bryobacterales bacterium]
MDERQRQAAVRPDGSFLVQAPAGSGKTSLLTQRYLRLLAMVDEPEEILAITFTRKAAAEMRARILGELREAERGDAPANEYQVQTREFALAALRRDRERQWQVLSSPRRLRIQTIDSFEASLVGRLPTLSQFGFAPAPTERAAPLYAAAVREALRSMATGESRDALIELLCLFDNNLETASRSLATLLEKRDQWMPAMGANPLGEAGPAELRRALEASLRLLVEPAFDSLRAALPLYLDGELGSLGRFASSHFEDGHPLRACLAGLSGWPATNVDALSDWRALAGWLLTEKGTVRRSLTVSEGFPKDRKEPKQRMLAVLQSLAEHDDFVLALGRVRCLPDPFYTDSQWRALEAFFRFLREVVPQLFLQFTQRRETDFAEIALRATSALEASPGVPSLLAERLDAQIRHLLVDEFQDTSVLQMLLVRKLTENWAPGDGRTLFLVGDPMQSIYGWRNARVELFLRAWGGGSAGLPPLETLQLQRNFRSKRQLIETFNSWLKPHFPEVSDPASGAVCYAEAWPDPAERDDREDRVQCHAFLSATHEAEAEWIAAEIERVRQNEQDLEKSSRIGVLFRKGANAAEVGQALTAKGIRFQAIDVEPLGGLSVIQDLRSLWRALESPEDRLAWLSVLRAPWNALTLAELEQLSKLAEGEGSFLALLLSGGAPEGFGDEARLRLRRMAVLFEEAFAWRGRLPAADLLRTLWERSGAQRYYDDARSQMAARQFLRLLTELEEADLLRSAEVLDETVGRLLAPPDPEAPDTLQLLTIHKAKGLEFDIVFVPYLNAGRPINETPPLAWEELPLEEPGEDGQSTALVIAPRHAIGESRSDLSALLAKRQGKREEHERLRVLYVALTRAKAELHLLATIDPKNCVAPEELQAKTGSYLGMLWQHFEPCFEETWHELRNHPVAAPEATGRRYPVLRRLAAEELPQWAERTWQKEAAVGNRATLFRPTGALETAETAAGTVFHRLMERVGTGDALEQAAQAREALLPVVREELRVLLPGEPGIDALTERVMEALSATARSAIGRWVFQSDHREVRAEQAVGYLDGEQWKTVRIDRLFRDASGTLHIVDFKLVDDAANDPSAFLRAQRSAYQRQVEHYARLMQREQAEPVRISLYFPLQDLIEQWTVEPLTRTA